jgi:thioredoxin-like negative regulator of GroEL
MRKIDSKADLENYTGLVLFSAAWCKPCVTYKPFLQEWAEKRQLRLSLVDADESRDLLGFYGIRSVPTTLFFIAGTEYSRKTGPMTELALNQLVP